MRTSAALLAVLCLTEACGAGWQSSSYASGTTLDPRQQVQVFQGRKMSRWHGVEVTADSISGIPFLESLDCATCRTSVARESVDSVRVGDPVAGAGKSAGLVLGVVVGGMLAICAVVGCVTGD
jgi:hypothetical protein